MGWYNHPMKIFLEKNLKYVVLAAALIFIGIGIIRGDMLVIFKKAAAICMECIGIG